MPVRLTVQQVLDSRAPHVLGQCATNLPEVCSYLNEAVERLLLCAPETGFWGTWARVAFNVDRATPYLTLPSKYSRAAGLDYCRTPVNISNDWHEFLEFGIGLQTECSAQSACGRFGAFDRGMFPTAYDLTATNQYIRVYLTDARDVGRKIFFTPALDQNGNGIYQQNGLTSVNGFMLTLASPFVTSSFIVTSFKEVIKDQTYGDVVVKQVDATTGAEVLLARYTPDETIPQYRRYLLSGLPCGCCTCPNNSSMVQVTAMCKLEFVPVKRPTDVPLIGNLPALKSEMEAIRFGELDSVRGQQMAISKHQQAVQLLNNELRAYTGGDNPAVNVSVFGTASLESQRIGILV